MAPGLKHESGGFMKPTVLFYRIPSAKLSALKPIISMLGARIILADDSMLMLTVEQIVCTDFVKQNISENLLADADRYKEEFMLMCGFSGAMLDKLLNYMNRKKLGVSLKAMLTETNKGWQLGKLIDEIRNERAQIASAMSKNK